MKVRIVTHLRNKLMPKKARVPDGATDLIKAVVFDVTVYSVVTNTDLTEGRGGRTTIGYYLEQSAATRGAQGQGVMGSDALVQSAKRSVVQFESGDMFLLGKELRIEPPEDPAVVRKRALDKLTPEERAALGV